MRISDWSSDVCSSDLLGEDAERLGECDLKLRGGESARVGDDLHIDIVGDVLPGGDGRLASGRRVRSKDAKPVDARRRLQLAERIQPPAAAPQRDRKSTRELQSLMRISYAVFCLKKHKHKPRTTVK